VPHEGSFLKHTQGDPPEQLADPNTEANPPACPLIAAIARGKITAEANPSHALARE
jgi:hypothetical protein